MPKKATTFEKPTVEQVKAFMMEKMADWPDAFAQYYAEKFWFTYEKSGWRLSAGKGGPMKSWTAAFHSNWKDLSYETDRKKLQTLQAEASARKAKLIQREGMQPATANEIGAELVNGLMAEFLAHPTHVSKDRLAACYDWIKRNVKIKLSKEQTATVIEIAEKDEKKAKATVVEWVFQAFASRGQNFSQQLKNA